MVLTGVMSLCCVLSPGEASGETAVGITNQTEILVCIVPTLPQEKTHRR